MEIKLALTVKAAYPILWFIFVFSPPPTAQRLENQSAVLKEKKKARMVPAVSTALSLVVALVALGPGAQCATVTGPSPKASASQTQTAGLTASSPPVAADPCGPSVPDSRVINSCGDSDDSFLSNTTSGGPEPYAVQCLNNGTTEGTPDVNFNPVSCIDLILPICIRMTADIPAAPYTQNKWIWFNGRGCSLGYWLPGPYQGVNSAGQKVTVEPARITDEDSCEVKIFGSMSDTCFVQYDMATVNLAELPSEDGTGAPAPGGSAPGYPSYIIAPQQVGGCEDAICYNADSVRVACNCL